MALEILTKEQADTLKAENTTISRQSVVPLETLGYCKETGKMLVRTNNGVQEVSTFLTRTELDKIADTKTGLKNG